MREILMIICILIFISPYKSYAHPGNTDEFGGHYDLSTGDYHYHHGFEAHYHPNGICPFGNIDTSRENVVTLEDYNNTVAKNKKLEDDIKDITYKYNVISRENEDLKEYNEELSNSSETSYIPYIITAIVIVASGLIISSKDTKITFLNSKVSNLSKDITNLNIRLEESYKQNRAIHQELKLLKSYDETKILENRKRMANIFSDWIPGDDIDYSKPLDRKDLYVKKSTTTKKYHTLDCKIASKNCTTVPIYDVPYFYKPCKICDPQPIKSKKQIADELGLNPKDFD